MLVDGNIRVQEEILNVAFLLNVFSMKYAYFSSVILGRSQEEQSHLPECPSENCEGILTVTMGRDAAD